MTTEIYSTSTLIYQWIRVVSQALWKKIYSFLLLLIVPGLKGSHVSVVPDVTVKTTLWNLEVLNANTPPRWKLTLLCRTNIWPFFWLDTAVYHSNFFPYFSAMCLFTYSGLSSVHVAQGGASSHAKNMVYFLQRLSVIAIFWCYCFIPHNEFQGTEEQRKQKMSSEIIAMIPKSGLHSLLMRSSSIMLPS